MNSIITSFNYTLEMTLLIGSEKYPIRSSYVKSIIINSDYDKNTMPIIYVGLSINPELYNKFVLNSSRAFVSFRLFKFNSGSGVGLEKAYIDDKFIYAMTDNPNYNESMMEKSNSVEDGTGDTFMEGHIALMNLKSINDNKKTFNTIIKNSNLASIIHNFTNHMTMCIEPFDKNPDISQLIIPPITSLKNLLSYINDNYCFYKSGYRYFRDFDTTYLLSNSGKSTTNINNTYNTVILSIRDPQEQIGNSNSIELNREAKAYIININASSTSINIDKLTDKTVNSIIGVDFEGNTEQIVLNIPSNSESTEKVMLERTQKDNLDYIYNIKNNIESSSIVLTASKTEIDSTILSPNKEYFVRNYDRNSDYDGRYILSFKKEALMQQNDTFIGNVIFGLRKINEGS